MFEWITTIFTGVLQYLGHGHQTYPNTRLWPQCRRQWPNFKPALDQSLVFAEIFVPFFKGKQGTLLFLGIDNAGKTSLLHRLKYNRMAANTPTGLPNSEKLEFENITFTTYDLGGHKQVRRVWKDYCPAADAIVFLVDTADFERLNESRIELDSLLGDDDIRDIPIAVLMNKIDKPHAANEETIKSFFDLHRITTGKVTKHKDLQGRRPLEVFPCSVLNEQGYGLALRWIAEQL